MMHYWRTLNDRERLLVVVAGLVVLSYLMYVLLISPLNKIVIDKTLERDNKAQSLAWMTQAAQSINQQGQARRVSNNELLSIITDALKQGPLQRFTYQLQQSATGDIELSFDQVPFSLLMSWFWSLNQSYVFSVKTFSSEKTTSPGVVKLSTVIAAG